MRVLVEGPWQDEADGWCISLRAQLVALASAAPSWKLYVKQTTGLHQAPSSDAVLEQMRGAGIEILPQMATHTPPIDIRVTSSAFMGEPYMLRYFYGYVQGVREFEPAVAQVFHTMIERDRISSSVAAHMTDLDLVLVPCTANRFAFGRSGLWPRKLRLVYYPWFPDDPHLPFAEARAASSTEPSYYWIGRWEPRKAPDRLLRAFLTLYRPGRARLTMKSSKPFARYSGYYKDVWEGLEAVLAEPEVRANGWTRENLEAGGCRVTDKRLPPEDIAAIHRTHRTYVSPSHGEGIDLPAFAAKLSGNRLVCSRSGGPGDFVGANDVQVGRPYASLVHPYYGWERDARWGDYPQHELTDALRKAAELDAAGVSTADWPKERFCAAAVGASFREALEHAYALHND